MVIVVGSLWGGNGEGDLGVIDAGVIAAPQLPHRLEAHS
jgi:hypothetical protein